jgi:hypothetical protein
MRQRILVTNTRRSSGVSTGRILRKYLSGSRTANQYDHLLVFDGHATSELIMPAQVLDVRDKASTNKAFYKTTSGHLPVVGRFFRNGSDDG